MTERPNAIFAGLIASATILTMAFAAALLSVGLGGVAALAATTLGALTACVFFLAELRKVPLSALVLVVLALASLLGFVRTLWMYRRARRLLSSLPLDPVADGPLARLASDAGVQLFTTPARKPEAFCFGLLHPRVVVSTGLLERLDADKQAAVVWHEAEHARNREPLKCLLAQLAANSFFWVPTLRDLLDRFLLVKELAADRRAVARTSTTALAGALYEIASAPSMAAVGAGDFATARVDRLLGQHAALPPLLRLRSLTISAIGATALTLTLVFPAQLDLGEQTHMQSMLTSLSLHGLPGMTAGLLLNGIMLTLVTSFWRRLSARNAQAAAQHGDS